MTKTEQFFYDNAGFSYPTGTDPEMGHTECAKQLAQAEQWLATSDCYWEIHPDPDSDESFMESESQEYRDEWSGTAWFWQIYDAKDHVIASLGSCYGNEDYKRVVRAELALEAMKPEDFADFVPAGDIPMVAA